MSSVPIGYLFPALLLTWAMLFVVAPKGWPGFSRFLGFYDWPDTTTTWSPAGRERSDLLPASPLPHARTDAPPFLVLHGDRDTTLPVVRARLFAHHLRSISHHPVVYAELPGAEHNFDLFHSFRSEAVINGVEAFVAWVQANPKALGEWQ